MPETAPQTVWCDHAGVLVLAPVLVAVAQVANPAEPLFKQWLASLLLGALNIEQTKFLNWPDLSRLLGTVVRFPYPQRQGLERVATPANIEALARFNAQLMGADAETCFYFDPHTKHYTGEQNVLEGWCPAICWADKAMHSDFIHTISGEPLYFETTDNFADLRERFFEVVKHFRQAMKWPEERELSFILDRGIFGKEVFEKVLADPALHLITWEKGYERQNWPPPGGISGSLVIERARNHAEDIRCYRLEYWDRPWPNDLRHTKIVVASGRHFENDRQSAFKAGADEYVTKPIDPDRFVLLLSRIAAQASSVEKQPSAAVPHSPAPARVKFWGVRGSIATPGPTTVQYGGNTSCVEVRADGQIIVLDAGTGMRLLGLQLVAEFEAQPLELTLLLTHTHWDHIQGLPFFLPFYKPQNRLRILGYEGARRGLEVVLAGQMESPFFPIGLREVPANVRIEELKEMHFHVGQVRVQAAFANHPRICVGYRLFTSTGSIAFFPDNEPFPEGAAPPRAAGAPVTPERAFAQGENLKLAEFLHGTDVLIMDTQYDASEYKRHTGWGHGCLDDVVALALQAEVKRLFLFHHDPNHDDAKISQMLAHARKRVTARNGKLLIEAACEGATVELPVVGRA